MSDPKPEDFRHFIPMAVRWGDVDVLGHVNNVQYFRYGESARVAYFEALEQEDPRFWKDYGIILANIGCDFLSQLRYPAELRIGTRVTRLGRSSIGMMSAVFHGDLLAAVLRSTVAWFDYTAQKTLPVPAHVRTWVRSREALAPEE